MAVAGIPVQEKGFFLGHRLRVFSPCLLAVCFRIHCEAEHHGSRNTQQELSSASQLAGNRNGHRGGGQGSVTLSDAPLESVSSKQAPPSALTAS